MTTTGTGVEEASENVVEDQDADWRQVVQQSHADEREALVIDADEPMLGHDRDTLEIERIATKFGRGGNRRKVRG